MSNVLDKKLDGTARHKDRGGKWHQEKIEVVVTITERSLVDDAADSKLVQDSRKERGKRKPYDAVRKELGLDE
ncbi:MAG: hypothetical protein HUU29_13800 [Planctomycetaceae bacterium]|nr:hypothetical protein [Planctomycetaceae bacterium]